MRQLNTVDALFVAFETDRWPLHFEGVVVLDPSTAPEPLRVETLTDRVEGRLPLLPPFRRRLVGVPLGIDRPYWVEDPDLDLEAHVHGVTVPAPGGLRELADLVVEIGARPLDRNRPLWELWLVDGLEGGRLAVVEKIHHACMDGMGGIRLLDHLFDQEPDPPEQHPEAVPVDRLPSSLELLVRSAPVLAVAPVRAARNIGELLLGVARGRLARRGAAANAGGAFHAPRVSFNRLVEGAPHKALALVSVPLGDVRLAADAFGTTVNDVALALCAGSLRRFLAARGELPDEPLVAATPVNVRRGEEAGEGNRVSLMFPKLPTQMEDPVERLRVIHDATVATKAAHRAGGGDVLEQWGRLVPPAVWSLAIRGYVLARLAARHPPAFNVVISNIVGPTEPRSLCGARVVSHTGSGMIYEGLGLVIGLMSNDDSLDFGVSAVRELTPDPWPIAQGIRDELDVLREAAGLVVGR